MSEKRKISIRKILQLVLTIVAASGCVVALISASRMESAGTLRAAPIVSIKNDRKYQFIEQKEILDIGINKLNIDVMHTPMSSLNLRAIEDAIKADRWVENAEVYIDLNRIMRINVTQRVPVARIFKTDGHSYYIDSTLHTMPISGTYTYYTTVVTNAPEMNSDSTGMAQRAKLVKLVRTLNTDTFWRAQVAQIDMDSAGQFWIVPVVGTQNILIGDTLFLREKLANLMSFYQNILNKIGWDKYTTLDMRFRNQVIASPSLPYKKPVDKSGDKMNWITTTEVTEAKIDKEDSTREAIRLARVKQAVRLKEIRMREEAKKHPVKKTVVAKSAPAPKHTAAHTSSATKAGKAVSAKPVAKPKAKPGHATAAKPVHSANKNKKTNVKDSKKAKTPKYTYPDKKKH